ncbi:prolyl oligopeptidase family serine peptidase [Solwaraspora sp. WMMD406]|uniref:prolyl oligopeptidase family serine peptidase n=1 Tax=Solwaraspora sp. WMMD406 TaxID=3016095 RepID=UPI0024171F58|nr:prolyl oligopeptidase family serine peptidase [Solwaraspora sp. WMMD406]MDG4764971.1 prolyl oligopeptidase family serine peptidase [Solwaraspora sp. WMMD406]
MAVEGVTAVGDDEHLWLEEVAAERALDWVGRHNTETVEAFAADPRFTRLRQSLREVLDSADRIPQPAWRGTYLYNLWQDKQHPRGLWRRASVDSYRQASPLWEVLLDIDELARAEGVSWVWQAPHLLRPSYDRCLVRLSRGGSDAAVVREFDLTTREFVDDGFVLPEAKSTVGWIDVDHIYVGTDFGPGSLTTSGYPRTIRSWRRGTALADAPVVFSGDVDDVLVSAAHDPTPGYTRDVVTRRTEFFRSETYLLRPDGAARRIEVPTDAEIDLHRQWLVIRLRSAWRVGAAEYPAGAVLVTALDPFLAGERDLAVVFEPTERTSFSYHVWTRDHLLLATLTDVRSEITVLTPRTDGWERRILGDAGGFDHTEVVDTEPDQGDGFLLDTSGFTRPPTLLLGSVDGPVETLKRGPAFFDADQISVRQFFAVSADGTEVPYFLVAPDAVATAAPPAAAATAAPPAAAAAGAANGADADGTDADAGSAAGLTLMTGYGGFEVAWTPAYSGIIGRGWLARGGSYVVANIRGGGEYGPRWHDAALRENRPRAYEDFAAVATDLVARGLTTPDRLGIFGGSNGGLLMGVMLTRYPELFGAIVGQVPLLDMRRYHKLLAGASWMAEYGDPDDPADWAFLRGYSPYHNIAPGRPYPPTLFVTSTRDDRVHPGHARKMVARLREHGYDVSYYENVEGGHGAAADNAQQAFKWALLLEFVRRALTADRR